MKQRFLNQKMGKRMSHKAMLRKTKAEAESGKYHGARNRRAQAGVKAE